jgi:hypothetical protein
MTRVMPSATAPKTIVDGRGHYLHHPAALAPTPSGQYPDPAFD